MLASSAAAVAFGVNFTNVGALAERMAADYRVGLATIGLFTTVLVAAHTLVQIPGGRATDRFGARTLAAAALTLLLVCNVGLSVAPDPAFALGLRAAAGVGVGIGFVAAAELVRSSGGTAIGQGLYGGIGSASAGVTLAVVPRLEQVADWRAPYVAALVSGGVALLLIATIEREQPRARPVRRERVEASMFADGRLYRLAAMHGVALLSVVIGNWTSTLFVRGYGLDAATAGLIGALVLAGSVLTRPAAGWIVHHRPHLVRPMLAASLVAGAAGTLTLAVAPLSQLAVIGAAGVGLAAGVPFAPAIVGAARVRSQAPGAAVGFVNALGSAGIVVGTPLLGFAFALPGDGRIGFAVVAAIWLGGLLALPRASDLRGVRPPRYARRKPD